MTYLLDVNVIIALVHRDSVFHDAVSRWVKTLDRSRDRLAFCALSELGVVRILPQLPETGYGVNDAQLLLARLKKALRIAACFLLDELDAQSLPTWVRSPRQTTDGHLLALAQAHGAILVTLDRKIPQALVLAE